MTLKTVFYCVAFSSALTACSAKELYHVGKSNQVSYCNKSAGHEREQCLKKVNQKSYEIYEQERQQVIKDEVDHN